MDNTDLNLYKNLIEEHILDFLPEVDHKSFTVYESMRYSLAAGGKRIRPILLLAACDFAGGDVKNALPYACAVEYIHTYSLIHDDLPAMDNDDLRRGIPTNHRVFGEAMAILAGDGLLTSAFEAMNKDMLLYFDNETNLKRRVKASYELAKGAGCRGMVAGQAADIEAENKQCSREMLDYIHINKTGALIVAAVRAGAHLGGADKKMLEDLTDYAEVLGLAFQIGDDILDVEGTESIMGKKANVDKNKNKSTYPCCYGLEESRKRLMELTETAKEIMAPYYDEAEFFNKLAEELAVRVK
jgi:geranylgeranyl diphosphate synthase type II